VIKLKDKMKIIITDATYKHSLAIARYIKKYNNNVDVIGFIKGNKKNRFLYKLFLKEYSNILFGNLETILNLNNYDLVIPVGASSAEIAARSTTTKKVLPSLQSIKIALNKIKTLRLAEKLGIPIPHTMFLITKEDLGNINVKYPCVIKGSLECGKSLVKYANNKNELENFIDLIYQDKSQGGILPIIQEHISGVGVGFFGFYQNGKLKRFYIHKRLREYPITGGPSTAAETFYHPKIFEYGKKMLDELNWNGVAMVEFKYDEKVDKLWLMEINPKFWGSCELGLVAGINFGELIIKSFKGENIKENLSPDSYKRIKFYWPLDNDILHILKNKKYKSLLDYLKTDYKSNFLTNGALMNIYKFLDLLRRLLK